MEKKERKKRIGNNTNFFWGQDQMLVVYSCLRLKLKPDERKIYSDLLGHGLSYGAFCAKMRSIEASLDRMTAFEKMTDEDCRDLLQKFRSGEFRPTLPQVTEIKKIITNPLIEAFLKAGYLNFNGDYINAENLIELREEKDLFKIPSHSYGCYFIFSNLPKRLIPSFSEDLYKCYDAQMIVKDGVEYRCIYNGKGTLQDRLGHHLFNSHTTAKVLSGKAKRLTSTGGISLQHISLGDFEAFKRQKKVSDSPNLKRSKFVKPCSDYTVPSEGYYLNGVDITEAPWNDYRFAVIVLSSETELGKTIIEEAFAHQHGRPPLCRRHG